MTNLNLTADLSVNATLENGDVVVCWVVGNVDPDTTSGVMVIEASDPDVSHFINRSNLTINAGVVR